MRPGDAYALRYGQGTVYLSHDDYAIDWESFKFVVVRRPALRGRADLGQDYGVALAPP